MAVVDPTDVGTSRDSGKYNKHLHIRDKIRASKILQRVEQAALGEISMTKEELAAAKLVLAKCIPDLQSIQLTGDPNNPVQMVSRVERVIVNK